MRLTFSLMGQWWEAAIVIGIVVLVVVDRYIRIDRLGRELDREERTPTR